MLARRLRGLLIFSASKGELSAFGAGLPQFLQLSRDLADAEQGPYPKKRLKYSVNMPVLESDI